MPIFEQGYRTYDHELSRRSRVLAIAWENIRTRFRWWIWLLLAFAWLFPWLLYGILMFVFTAGRALMGMPAVAPVTAPSVAFEDKNVDLEMVGQLMGAGSGDSLYIFWDAMQNASLWNLMVPAVACAGILAADRRTGALQIYFARPITALDYMLSKLLATAAFGTAVTGVPALLLWVEACLFSPDSGYILKTWMAPFSILAATTFYALWASAFVLALSSAFKRPVFVGIAMLVIYLMLVATSVVFEETLNDQVWRVLRPGYLLGCLTAPFFGMGIADYLRTPWLIVLGLFLPAGLLGFAWFRMRSVEVAT